MCCDSRKDVYPRTWTYELYSYSLTFDLLRGRVSGLAQPGRRNARLPKSDILARERKRNPD